MAKGLFIHPVFFARSGSFVDAECVFSVVGVVVVLCVQDG
jgi:hypothetical protein